MPEGRPKRALRHAAPSPPAATGATTLGGIFDSVPFIISNVNHALVVAGIVVAIELLVIAWVRHRFLRVSLRSSLVVVTLGGAIALAIGSRSAAPDRSPP